MPMYNLIEDFIISDGNRETTFSITDTNLYVPFITLSAQDKYKISIKNIDRMSKSIFRLLN